MIRIAVLLNRTLSGQPGARLAGLSLAARAVLSAQQAGIERVLILGGEDPARWLPARGQARVEWLPGEDGTEVAALRRLSGRLEEPFLVFFADSVVEPRALALLRPTELNGRLWVRVQPASAEEGAAASVYVASPALLGRLESVAARLATLEALWNHWDTGEKDCIQPAEGLTWERTTDRKRLSRIERELALSQLKPTDGVFARFNKTVVGWPLIRLFVRTPATPNFISGLGLVLGLLAGGVFAHGGYWWALLGSLFMYASAIMDHVDGMVARLKFQQSDFGTWFETTVDYTSYFAVYVGMGIGLYRENQHAYYLLLGGLFAFGAVVSYVVQNRQRRIISGDRPADYARRWHAKTEAHGGEDFFHYFARKTYFLIRRAVAPYFIILFCLLDIRGYLLAISALTANLVWSLTLYNNRLFERSPVLESSSESVK